MESIAIEPLLAHCGAQVIFMILNILKDLSLPAKLQVKCRMSSVGAILLLLSVTYALLEVALD